MAHLEQEQEKAERDRATRPPPHGRCRLVPEGSGAAATESQVRPVPSRSLPAGVDPAENRPVPPRREAVPPRPHQEPRYSRYPRRPVPPTVLVWYYSDGPRYRGTAVIPSAPASPSTPPPPSTLNTLVLCPSRLPPAPRGASHASPVQGSGNGGCWWVTRAKSTPGCPQRHSPTDLGSAAGDNHHTRGPLGRNGPSGCCSPWLPPYRSAPKHSTAGG